MLARPPRNRLIAALIVVAVAASAAGLCWASEPLGLRGGHKDWFVQVDATTLVQFTDQIVVARYLDETIYETPHPGSPSTFVDVYRGFVVVESLKGDFEAGDIAYVIWSEGYYRRNGNGDLEFVERPAVELTPGEAYVLFLNPSPGGRPAGLDASIRVWRTAEGLVAARIDPNGRLSFKTNAFYRAALADMGLKPVRDSGAPFELTLSGIRELVSTEPSLAR